VPIKKVAIKKVPTHEGTKAKADFLNTHVGSAMRVVAAASDDFCHVAADTGNGSTSELADALHTLDRAGTLRAYLLTPRGLEPYRHRLAQHGELVHFAIADVLMRLAMDGAPPDKIKSWRYFDGAIADAVRAETMARQGLRPGDLLGAWRDAAPLHVPF
jgi:hypothetical protein